MHRNLLLLTLSVLALVGCDPPFRIIDDPKPGFDGGFPPFEDGGFVDGSGFCPKPPTSSDGGLVNPEPVFESSRIPKPISGGTLIVTRDGHLAVAADPERDRLWAVDLRNHSVVADVALQEGDEPGRLIEDAAGHIHVLLRSGGAVATVDLARQAVVARRPVCAAPRGIAYDAVRQQLNVACADGEFVTLGLEGDVPLRKVMLDPDFRDVTVQGDSLLVTRFRSAEILRVDGNGTVQSRLKPPVISFAASRSDSFEPAVAWRTVSSPLGAVVVHQNDFSGVVEAHCDGYGATASRPTIVSSAITFLGQDGKSTQIGGCLPPSVVLPVDVAISHDGQSAAIVSAGTRAVFVVPTTRTPVNTDPETFNTCPKLQTWTQLSTGQSEPTAVAFDAEDRTLTLTREPALYVNGGLFAALPGEPRPHTGFTLFHRDAGRGLACASCHPEATHDGRTWAFSGIGPRRTQSLVGGILSTAPFHWDGDLPTMGSLMNEVFVNRMGGQPPSQEQVGALGRWLDAQPAPVIAPPPDLDRIGRGRTLFHDPNVGCATCHNGPRYTNNANADVGTGGFFQVPQLMGLALRAPYLHNGCARTLLERFGPCGGGESHGHTAQLSAAQLDDLVAFLETL